MQIGYIKKPKALRAEVYQLLTNEIIKKGFEIEVKFIYTEKKSKKRRKILNPKCLSLLSLCSKEDKILSPTINEEGILPEILTFKLAKTENDIVKHFTARSVPLILFYVGIETMYLSQLIQKYDNQPLAYIWINPSQRPLIQALLVGIDSSCILNNFTAKLEKSEKKQKKLLEIQERKADEADTYFSKIEVSLERIRSDIKNLVIFVEEQFNEKQKENNEEVKRILQDFKDRLPPGSINFLIDFK